MNRGTYRFETDPAGRLLDTGENLERARSLFRDGEIIGRQWGPGNPGDFDNGSWHSLCHAAAAAGVLRAGEAFLWAAITPAMDEDRYQATVSRRIPDGGLQTAAIASPEGRAILQTAALLGYVEGTSLGHISARTVRDTPELFNKWLRQDFDRPGDDDQTEGGTVWEHWCTTRDLRTSSPVGDSVLRAYLTLTSVLGGLFTATVVRGRRKYHHPEQLCALVKSGFIDRSEALRDVVPLKIPEAAERLFREARVADSLNAAASLPWKSSPERQYFMFGRAIRSFSPRTAVEADLRAFGL